MIMSQINIGGRYRRAPYDTKLMRIPTPLESQVLQIKAKYIEFLETGGDVQQPPNYLDEKPVNKNITDDNEQLISLIKKLVNKINSKQPGYKSNSAGQLIKDVMELYDLVQDIEDPLLE